MALLAGAQETEDVQTGNITIKGQGYAYRIRRLPVSAFPGLPVAVASVLEARHCSIPQTYEAKRPENVIHGTFFSAKQESWAALCSHDAKTELLAFSSSSAEPEVLASHAELDLLLPINARHQAGFAWAIDAVKPGRMKFYARTQTFDHEGIEDSLVESSSQFHYFRQGHWTVFDGMQP